MMLFVLEEAECPVLLGEAAVFDVVCVVDGEDVPCVNHDSVAGSKLLLLLPPGTVMEG
jgi:hypothetical protein